MEFSELRIGFDPGSSLTKVVYAVNGGHPKILMMEPDVISLPTTSMSYLELGPGQPEDKAWIKLNQTSDTVQVCGFLAREFLALERTELLKYEHAFYKFLAAVGVIVVKEKLNRVVIHAGVLLPYGEINSRDWMREKVAKSLKKYYFRNTVIRGRLQSFSCISEGSGMAWRLISKFGKDWFSSRRVIVLIFGYRNLSCITFHRGLVESQRSSTSDLGFVKLIDKVIFRTSGQDRKTLAEAIYNIGADIQTSHPYLRGLIKSTQPENIEVEAETLVKAIKSARIEYWQLVQAWIDTVVPSDLDRLAVSGGTALYLKTEIDRHLNWTEPDWIDSRTGELSRMDSALQFRFADVMSLFESTLCKEKAA
jgi:hypothetical protein